MKKPQHYNKQINLFFLAILTGLTSVFSQNIYEISDPEELENINLSSGDEVILADGTYSSDERILFSGTGTASSPITFRAETPGGVVFSNGLQMDIAGEYLIVDGFYWNGGYGASNFIQFRNGTTYAQNSTIQNCAINGLTAEPGDAEEAAEEGAIIKHRWIVLYGNYNSVLNCTFMNKNTAGALVLAEYEYNASPDEVANTRCDEVGHVISNNYFYNYEKIDSTLSNAGDSETIRIGTSEYQNVNSQALISGNYFVQADGENEIITNKSMNNNYLNNTFRRCRGSLVMRHGSDATVTGNYFLGENVEGTGAIRITDSNHVITNNYIQDCVTSTDNAVWNNGLTFVGGNTNSVQNCNSTSVSNSYQDVENINFSNNTFINTDTPIYFNATRDGADDVFGTVSNNLIYFEGGNDNITNVINGSYSEIGANLTFSGNIYDGASSLGESASGFTSESISVSANGEIFTHNQSGKGASISSAPITDSMVGNGIGACFLGAEGNDLTGCDGTIIPPPTTDSLTVSSLSSFDADGDSQTITITSNVDWTVSENSNWITINRTSGSDNGSVSVTTTENTSTNDRSATITVSGSGISRSVTVSQDGAEDNNNNFTSIPALIQAEDFDTQLGIRTENTNDNGGGENVGYIDTGDFLTYDINVPSSGTYTIDFRIASRTNGTEFDIFQGNSAIGNVSSAATGGWQTWETVSVDVNLTAGNQTLMLVATGTGWNINWLDISTDEDTNNAASCTEGTNLSLNGTIVDFSAEQNDTNSVNNIINEDDDDRWSAEGFPQYATIDLGDQYNVNEVDLSTYQDRGYEFTIEGSITSGTSGFFTLTTGNGPGSNSFSTQTVRYVKLTITGGGTYTGAWSSISDFEIICAGSSSKNILADEFFEVTSYPNPFLNKISINAESSEFEIGSVELIDISGKLIVKHSINSNKFELNNLSYLTQGIYLLKVLNSNNQVVKVIKVVK